MIDSHCHLDDEQFDSDRVQTIERAVEAGIELMLSIGTGDGPPDLEAAVRLADVFEPVYATVGVHPHNAAKADSHAFDNLRTLLSHPKVIALGEIGLDYHYDFSPRERQREVFVEQIRIARAERMPIVIHTREAWDETVLLLQEHWAATGLPGIMHCFTGGPQEAKAALDLGFSLSFGGVVTFPKALENQEAARQVPLERLLIETDSPYLAPVPYRGKRNEPAFIVHTAQKIADLRGIQIEELEAATAKNFRKLFLQPERAA
jgi:TatD DNase family protein